MQKKRQFMTRRKWIVLLSVVLVLLIALGLFGHLQKDGTQQEAGKGGLLKEAIKTAIKDAARPIKAELFLLVEDILEENVESARSRAQTLSSDMNALRTPLSRGLSLMGDNDSSFAKRLRDMEKLLNTADMAMADILLPALDLLEEHPASQLKVGDGFNTRLIVRYLDFAESVMPKVEEVMESVNSVDLSLLDEDGDIIGYVELANKLMDFYREHPNILSHARSMLGVQEDRLYVIAVQNPSEIRASGGFPGSMGTVRISGGVMTVEEFSSVVNMMSTTTPRNVKIEKEEWELFRHLSGIQNPRDADLCPDFERVGYIWAMACEEKLKEPVSGVISVSPHIVQRLLAVAGEQIELSDGTVMDGENALKVLVHDIYYKYFSRNYVPGREEISDALFAEAAEKTMEILTEQMSVSQIPECLSVFEESIADRTLMMWMKDEAEQAFVAEMGWSGGLNKDPEKPETGVYFNCVLASKMGWYILIDTDIGERTPNDDGSYTYPVTVTFTNIAEAEEIKTATSYITGGRSGSIYGVAFFFAPAGGTVSDFAASNGQTIPMRIYHGLELGFMDQFNLKPGIPVTVTYQVTTAPDVETPLGISKTPTAQ